MNRAITRSAAALVRAAAISLTMLLTGSALAQSATGRIQGKIEDAQSHAPVGDVVITATSPALQGEQTVVSDATGEYEIPALPPGTYLLHMEKEGYKPLNQPDVKVFLDKTVRVTTLLRPESMKAEEVVIIGKPPTVDIGSTQTGSNISSDFLNNIPVASPNSVGGATRSFESLAATSPGAHEDAYGVGISGATSPENNYVIDGVNVTDPGYGLLGTSLSIDFIKEVNVITGGYMPEYGRATGGVENVVTKSGGNEFHGSLGLYVEPGLQAKARELTRLGDSISTENNLKLNGTLSAEVGGYIVKDRLWFYVGFSPTITQSTAVRRLSTQTYLKGCPVDANGAPTDPADADHFDSTVTSCPDSDKGVVTNSGGATGLPEPIPAGTTPIAGSERTYYNNAFSYQYLAKLTFLLNQDQTFTGSVFGNPTTFDGPGGGNLNGQLSAFDVHSQGSSNDYSLRWNGSFLDKHVLAEAVLGWHHQDTVVTPHDPTFDRVPQVLWRGGHALNEFEPDAAQYCGSDDVEDPASGTFSKCRVENYASGGPGFLQDIKLDRWSGRLALTNLFRAAGHHEVKYGLDYELMKFDDLRHYTGGVELQARTPKEVRDIRRYGYLNGPDDPVFFDSWHSISRTTSLAGFLQDSYRILDLITLNAGVRWENQQLYQGDGSKVINLPNNVMPRVGLIYDWTGTGRSKVYANYGLFYEAVPMDILDRQFPSERQIFVRRYGPQATTPTGAVKCNPADISQTVPGGSCQSNDSVKSDPIKADAETDRAWTPTGGASTPVDPTLQGQSENEVVLGTEYEVFSDARVGGYYTHRSMNRVIEDLSNDGGNTYFIANPGYGIASSFPKAVRDYDALSLYFNKAWAHRWMVQANYTLSRLYGNYSGLFRPETNQLDPNITSDFDLVSLLANRTGPLPGDHTHSLKVFAAREFMINETSSVTVGGSYDGLSGGPTNYLGSHPVYGAAEAFILPRGSGPRLPWIHEVDTSFKFNHKFSDDNILSASVDIFNILNLQQVTSVDENYTFEDVLPLTSKDQLANLKNIDNGQKAAVNPNFQHATSYQAPLTVRFGLKMSF